MFVECQSLIENDAERLQCCIATGSATPATSTESIEVAERSWLAVPSTMACDLSAFNSKLFDRYQSRSAVEHDLSTSSSCAESLGRMDTGQVQLSVMCILLMSDAETFNDIFHW